MAAKLTRPQPTRLSCVECDASSISQTSVKTKDYPKAAKIALHQIWDDLSQTTINKAINDFRTCLNACVSGDLKFKLGGQFSCSALLAALGWSLALTKVCEMLESIAFHTW